VTDQLDLKRLPRVNASDGFTDNVLRRVRAGEESRPAPSLRLAMVAVAVVVVSAAAGAWWTRQSTPAEPAITAESIEQLKSEYQELNRELESFRRLAEDTQPFVPVSIDPLTEVLFDLRDVEPLPVRYTIAGSRRIQ
jgi:Tfp pilus assembly protein PilN